MLFIMVNGLLLSLILLCYSLVVLTIDRLLMSVNYSIAFLIVSFIFFLSLVLYNIIWLRKQLKNGFSEERTNANYSAASSVYSPGSLWLILGLTLLGGAGALVFTQSWNGVMGILLNILFISAFSRLIVEVGYLTYLRFKDKSYWEEMPEELKNQTLWTVLDIRKTAPRLIIEVVLFLGLGISKQLFNIDDHHPVWLWLFRGMFYILAIDGSIAFIMYKIRQRKESK